MKEIKIKDQIWTAENYAGTTCPDGTELVLGKDYFYPNGQESNVKDYGLLYTWEAAQRVCPNGWHLPTNEEWNELTCNLKSEYWINPELWKICALKSLFVENIFNTVPAGAYYESYYGFGNQSCFWSATHDDNCYSSCAYARYLLHNCEYVGKESRCTDYAYSVRFVRYQDNIEKMMEEYEKEELNKLAREVDNDILKLLFETGKEQLLNKIEPTR